MPIQLTQTNELMDECLKEVEAYWIREKARLAALRASRECDGGRTTDEARATETAPASADALQFANLILCEIVRHKGCHLLRTQWEDWDADPDEPFVPTERFPDRSGYEDFENHLHVGDYIISRKSGIHFLIVGFALMEVIYSKLRLSFPEEHFRICVSFPVKPFECDPEDIHIRDDCTVRFHAIRKGEVIYGPLQGYHYEAMGILEF